MRIGLLTFALLFVGACNRMSPRPDATEPMNKQPSFYPLCKGDRREYRVALDGKEGDITAVVTEVTTRDVRVFARVEMKVGSDVLREEISADEKGLYLHAGPGGKYDPPATTLKYPPRSGDTWSEKYKVGGEETTAKTTIGDLVEVRVAAGQYKAFPVNTVITSGGQTTTATTWYAEGIGVVKMESMSTPKALNMTLDLRKFTTGN